MPTPAAEDQMPITYQRDDARQLIRVTVTDPYTANDIIGAIDRQAAEGTWAYAILYDLCAASSLPSGGLQPIADYIKTAGAGLPRGPLGIAVGHNPQRFRQAQEYEHLTHGLMTVGLLLTGTQIQDWLARNARHDVPRPKTGDVVIWDLEPEAPESTYWVKRQGRGDAAQLIDGFDAWARARSLAKELAGPDGTIWKRHKDGSFQKLAAS